MAVGPGGRSKPTPWGQLTLLSTLNGKVGCGERGLSNPAVILRCARPEDVVHIAAIWNAGWHDAHDGGVPEELVAARPPEFFPKRAAEKLPQTTVALVDGSVAGFVMVAKDELEHIYVDRQYRGLGIANRLLKEAEAQIAALGYSEAWLAVVASNTRARAFYARQGWLDRGSYDHHAYGDAGPIHVPAHRYVKPVSARTDGSPRLRDAVAVVAGATRGAGRGIAAALGEAGATVICTGRTSRATPLVSDYNRAETIEETAELVTSLGGVGIPVAVDHLDASQVKQLARRIRDEYGRLDILVNDIWGAELLKGGPADWNKPIWEHDLDRGLRILRLAIDTHLITAHELLPLLIERPGGLLVEVTDGTANYNASHYRLSTFYDLAKTAVNRLAFCFGHELEKYNATAVAISPGWLRSEMMLENFGVTESNWREALGNRPGAESRAPEDFALSESPRYIGRAIVALATDLQRSRWNKKSVTSGELAAHYGFTDVDGSKPDIWRYFEEVREGGRTAKHEEYR